MDFGNEFDRTALFEKVLETAEMNYKKNPLDAENLTRWGGTLVELSQYQDPLNMKQMLEDGISKLEEALIIEPKKPDILWCMGNAQTSLAFATPEHDLAKSYFEKASMCFQSAVDEDPGNGLYIKSLEMISKGPDLHKELHKHGAMEQHMRGRSSNEGAKVSKTRKHNKKADLTYDVFGWIFLAVGIIAWIGMAKSHVPPPPPR